MVIVVLLCPQDQAISARELQQMLNGVLSRSESTSSDRLLPADSSGPRLEFPGEHSFINTYVCVLRERGQVRRTDSQHLPQHHQPDGRILIYSNALEQINTVQSNAVQYSII